MDAAAAKAKPSLFTNCSHQTGNLHFVWTRLELLVVAKPEIPAVTAP
jgi:hypothetical protein